MFIIDDNHDNNRQEAVQILLNNATGTAAHSLERVIDSPVSALTPSTHWVNKNNLRATLASLKLPEKSIVMRQSFRGHLRGEVLVLLEHGAKHYQLGKVMGYEESMTPLNIQELTLELANVLSGACISGLSQQLNVRLNFGAPSLLSNKASVDSILAKKELSWTDALFMDLGYTVSSINMNAHLILCITEEDSQVLYQCIDQQLESE